MTPAGSTTGPRPTFSKTDSLANVSAGGANVDITV